jgi:hypothetical protein
MVYTICLIVSLDSISIELELNIVMHPISNKRTPEVKIL